MLSIVTAKLDFPKWVNCNDYRCGVAVALVEHASFVEIITLVRFHDVREGIPNRFSKLRLCRVHGRTRAGFLENPALVLFALADVSTR